MGGAPVHASVWCSGFPVARAGLAQCVVPTAFRHACFCQLFAMAQADEEWSSPAGWAWSPAVARERWCGLGYDPCSAHTHTHTDTHTHTHTHTHIHTHTYTHTQTH